MKLYIRTLILLLGSAPAALPGQAVQLGTLHVVIEGVKNARGQVKIGLEKTAAAFDQGPLHEVQYRGETVASKSGNIEVRFKDVPYGSYAIKSFHDEDGNGQLNTNFMGIPTEDYGFSNNARAIMGPPPFVDARFELSAPEITVTLRLK